MRDPYAELGVSRSADQDAIKKAYKDLAKRYHPDLNQGDESASERFKAVNAAYDILKDPEKRQLFDEFGDISLKPGFDAGRARAWKQAQGSQFHGFPSGEGEGVNLEDLLGSFFGGGGFGGSGGGGFGGFGGRAAPRRKGQDIEAQLRVDLGAVVRGEKIDVAYQRPEVHADGSVGRTTERIKVRIPPGVEEGGTVRLRGKGAPGHRGGPAGDLRLVIHFEPHPSLSRDGADLYLEVPLTIHEAVVGARIEVPTPDGSVRVKVPAGTATGQKLRLKGKGLPRQGGHGDLYLVLRPTPPASEDAEVARLAEALEAFYGGDVRADLRI